MIDIKEYVSNLGEQTPAGVTLTITASGDVGQGKSRAIEVVLAALAGSKVTMLTKVERHEVGRAEIAIVQMVVAEPFRSAPAAPWRASGPSPPALR